MQTAGDSRRVLAGTRTLSTSRPSLRDLRRVASGIGVQLEPFLGLEGWATHMDLHDAGRVHRPLVGLMFSRDRAMQVDALLRSFWVNCVDAGAVPLHILYVASSPQHIRQYESVARYWQGRLDLTFHEERDFRTDVLTIAGCGLSWRGRSSRTLISLFRTNRGLRRSPGARPNAEYMLFLVDDNIFYRPFSISAVTGALASSARAIGFSLRLGRNTTYCYSLDRPQRLPVFIPRGGEVLGLEWAHEECDFGYPLEVSSSVYPTQWLNQALLRLRFSNPNGLEAQLAAATSRSWVRRFPELLCFSQSVAFCDPVNMVQSVSDNRAGRQPDLASSALADKFDSGLRIDLRAFAHFTPNACHCEVPFSFVPEDSLDGVGWDSRR